ncbi:hypothetical protein CSHISOI_05669 [Colletotrichum shisoi]|uniref:Uncharacterized protein n=1 Tax=Colletotrichum shisoi TaxID=2078593 RepID=A0A5Q4BSB1_9PEZI|nr:hypothetical protein CSHISOI_05669 [Colletotrichum shisoi]
MSVNGPTATHADAGYRHPVTSTRSMGPVPDAARVNYGMSAHGFATTVLFSIATGRAIYGLETGYLIVLEPWGRSVWTSTTA